MYGIVAGGLLGALRTPEGLETDGSLQGGGTVGARLGFRFSNWGGFELMGHYNYLHYGGTVAATDVNAEVQAVRFGAAMRLMIPGTGWDLGQDWFVRLVATAGGGPVYTNLDWDKTLVGTYVADVDGYDICGQFHLGLEFEWHRFLIGMVAEMNVQSTGALEVPAMGESPFGSTTLPILGAVLWVGYGFYDFQ